MDAPERLVSFRFQKIIEVIPVMKNSTFKFGFSESNELLNGRLAMLGFAIGLATELITGQGIFSQLGLM
jgi:hypothetical protein